MATIQATLAFVESKACTRCGEKKAATLEFFDTDSRIKTGLTGMCRDCRRKRVRVHDRKYQPIRSERQNEFRKGNLELMRRLDAERRIRDRDRINARSRAIHHKQKSNPYYRVKWNMKTLVARSLSGKKNGQSWERLVGYTRIELAAHLERQFLPGMTWENYGRGIGKWSIDHIRPVDSFSFTSTDDDEFKQCWALSNLRPLWTTDNSSKGSKYDGHSGKVVPAQGEPLD